MNSKNNNTTIKVCSNKHDNKRDYKDIDNSHNDNNTILIIDNRNL